MKKQLDFDGTEKEVKNFVVKLPKSVKIQSLTRAFKKPIYINKQKDLDSCPKCGCLYAPEFLTTKNLAQGRNGACDCSCNHKRRQ